MNTLAILQRRLSNLWQRGTLKLVDDSTDIQQLQVALRSGQVRDKREHPTNYGFTHHPPASLVDIHMASQGGNTAKGVVIVVGDRQFRLKDLQEGEVALYDDQGQYIKLARDNTIEVITSGQIIAQCTTATIEASESCTLDTPLTTCTGDVVIEGNLTVVGVSVLTGVVNALAAVVTPLVAASNAVSAAISLKVGGLEMSGHKHGGVQTGQGTSGEPQ